MKMDEYGTLSGVNALRDDDPKRDFLAVDDFVGSRIDIEC